MDTFESGYYSLDAVFNGGSASNVVGCNGAGWIVEIYEIEWIKYFKSKSFYLEFNYSDWYI